MTLLVFFMGILNLGLGYALAVHWGYGPANLWEAWEALTADRPAGPRPQAAERPDALVQLADTPEPDLPEDRDLDEKPAETWVLKLNLAMMRSGARTAQIESRLRACRGRTDPQTIGKALADLKEDCRLYLAEQGEAAERLHSRIAELGDPSALGEEIEIANLEQAALVETTLGNLEQMDFASDLEAANQRLLEEIENLRITRQRLYDKQEAKQSDGRGSASAAGRLLRGDGHDLQDQHRPS